LACFFCKSLVSQSGFLAGNFTGGGFGLGVCLEAILEVYQVWSV